MIEHIEQEIQELLAQVGVQGKIELSRPPKAEMGDFAYACFAPAKEAGKNPVEFASELAEKLQSEDEGLVADVKAFGPYVNFFLDPVLLAQKVFTALTSSYGAHQLGAEKTCLVEFACPNPMKAFHLGHLKNLISGESVARILENVGYAVKRINYQGDVGMHIAKTLWGLFDLKDQFEAMKDQPLKKQVEFLGEAYAHGARYFEKGDAEKAEVVAYNQKVYEKDESIQDVYTVARNWSLEYFDHMYKRMDSGFDRLYFESEVFTRGKELVQEGLKEGTFKESDGAVIFEGSAHDLHDRVFLNSKGFTTYEAKELGLAEMHVQEFHPDKVVHLVGKEQSEYFKVLFKAIDIVFPELQGKEVHLPGGFLQLKGDQKMSSRTGNVVTGDQLIDAVTDRISQIMSDNDIVQDGILETVSLAALKYTMLKSGVSKDVAFDIEESVSVSGNSGPYLLYTVARINSILDKGNFSADTPVDIKSVHPAEKALLLLISEYPSRTKEAGEQMDPSIVAQYMFDLAQQFQRFYAACSVLQDDVNIQQFRLHLISSVKQVMVHGLNLLGITSVEHM
ncbi:arginine--tRNA ligase [Patescibacteria group bacterium]|nr:arginine--tRNA ligase [Patescibacteria group bacterium]MBU1721693.1 arginine--tRNA ligase [Patescibacteria group bacterium]MBU1901750.1 arginine--tRNA ligase [Patescibacteria group bacterium]